MKEKAAHGGTGKKGKDGIGRWDVYQVYEKKEIVTVTMFVLYQYKISYTDQSYISADLNWCTRHKYTCFVF